METPEHLINNETADAAFDFIEADWLSQEDLYDGWEDDFVANLISLVGQNAPEETDVWDCLLSMNLTQDNSQYSSLDINEDKLDKIDSVALHINLSKDTWL